ncbi:hypothetical protein GCM10023169_09200 [Georgenia halophila]|uniref:Uncharacterized protein n=1 Tax=Georgenia halophila TaxID=620889 RepID=A0ABP8KYY8_9MICO
MTQPESKAEPEEVPVAKALDRRRMRRAPRYGRFILVGILLGALASLVLSGMPGSSGLSRNDLFWLIFLGLGFFGGLLGAAVALLVDRVSLSSREHRIGRPAAGSQRNEEES